MIKNIAIIGGSNSVLQESYVNILTNKNKYVIDNKAIGATSSIYGLLQIQKYDLIKKNDLLIYEYFVNDNNHFFQGINSPERVKKTLTYIIQQCQLYQTHLLIIMIYNKLDYTKHMYSTSPMFNMYIELIKQYQIPFIDMYHVFYRRVITRWTYYYLDDTHLNLAGMSILGDEILKRIPQLVLPISFSLSLSLLEAEEPNTLSLTSIPELFPDHPNINLLQNSLVNIAYLEITDTLQINFEKPTELMAIEYVCDQKAGYISISASNNISAKNDKGEKIIQKNTLKQEDFVLKRNKSMVAVITFNKYLFEPATSYTIRIIQPKDLHFDYYDREKITYETVTPRLTTFKIASILHK